MPYWKFGINYGGMQNPPHYDFIHGERIAIGCENLAPFEVGDLVAITQGYTVLAIVQTLEPRQPIVNEPDYEAQCLECQIDFVPETIFASAEWLEFEIPAWLPIQLGAAQVHNSVFIAKIQGLWNARP